MTDLEKALAEGATPVETDLSRAVAEGATPVEEAPKEESHFLPHSMADVVKPFIDIGKGLKSANDFATQALTHPVDTAKQIIANPGATFREGMRGVNSNIPLANEAVEAAGGPAAESAEDAAAAPAGIGNFAGVAAMPGVGKMVGGIAAKGIEAVAPRVSSFISKVGKNAEDRTVDRALNDLELNTTKNTRAGIRRDVVADTVKENPELLEAAGTDSKVAKITADIKQKAAAELDKIYSSAAPTKLQRLQSRVTGETESPVGVSEPTGFLRDETFSGPTKAVEGAGKTIVDEPAGTPKNAVNLSAPTSNMDARIAELRKGTVNDEAVADKLQTIRDKFVKRLGERESVSAKELRAEQSAYQKNGYAKNIAGDPDVSATIAANREASKAVGDAVINHVTGMNYAEAQAYAAANPSSVAGRLLKANGQIEAANRVDAGMADRAARVQPKEGVVGKLLETAKEIKHSPTGYALSKVPSAAASGLSAADRGLARLANPKYKAAISRLVETAKTTPTPQFVAAAVRMGIPRDQAIKISEQAKASRPAPAAPADSGDITL